MRLESCVYKILCVEIVCGCCRGKLCGTAESLQKLFRRRKIYVLNGKSDLRRRKNYVLKRKIYVPKYFYGICKRKIYVQSEKKYL